MDELTIVDKAAGGSTGRQVDLLDEVAAAELLAGHMDGAAFAVPQEDGPLDWADNERAVVALVYHHLHEPMAKAPKRETHQQKARRRRLTCAEWS